MENERIAKKKELLKEVVEKLDEKTIDELLSILHNEKRTP